MTTPFNLTATVTDNITGEQGSLTQAFNVLNPNNPPPPSNQCIYGVYDPANDGDGSGGWSGGDGGVQQFEGPNNAVTVATYYVQWNGSFPSHLNSLCQQHNATLFLEMEPWFTTTTWPSFTGITSGASDSYLASIGSAIAAGGRDVWVTYAHEMNGSWYPWGNGGPQGITPSQWVASWKHVHDKVNATAGGHAKWVWAPNNNDVGSVKPYWPGGAYVDIAAYDGYLQNSSQTFSNFQSSTVNEIKQLLAGEGITRPIWNSECGINPKDGTQPARVTQFIADMKHAGLAGFMWWNQSPFDVQGASLQNVINAVTKWNNGTL